MLCSAHCPVLKLVSFDDGVVSSSWNTINDEIPLTHFVLFVLEETVVEVVVLFAPTAKIPSGVFGSKIPNFDWYKRSVVCSTNGKLHT